jgi:hypothetical protein
MNFQELVAKMQELEAPKTEAPVEQSTQECGMNEMPPMAPMAPSEPKDKASMTVNINAQGDAIDDVMALIKKMGGQDKPEMDMPTISMIPPMGMDEPEGPPMPKPINKLLPDFDGDNDDMPGGEKDLPKDHDKDHIMIKGLDKDGDMDHDMDDHDMEKDDEEDKKDKEEAYANEPDEDVRDIEYITKKNSGGMNRMKGTHPKVAGGDNPMQRVKEGEELRASIKEQLLKALEEHKGA